MVSHSNGEPASSEDRTSDDLYRAVFEHARTPMLLIEEDTTVSLCNRAFAKLAGYSVEEIQGVMSWTQFIADEADLERMREYHRLRRLDSALAPAEYEFGFVDAEGERKDIALEITMLPGTKRSICMWKDITEKKRTEAWYQAVFENTGLPSIIIDPATLIIKANTEWALLSGYSIREVEGKMSWTEFVHEEDLARMRAYHSKRRADATDAPRKYEFRFVRKNGELRDIINSVTMIPGSPFSIASLMDITDLREADAERKRLGEQLLQARKLESIGHLAGGVAHDFNNMLAAILGYSELVRRRHEDGSAALEKSGRALRELETAAADPARLRHAIEGCAGEIEGEIARQRGVVEMLDEVVKASLKARDITRQLLAFARKQTLEVKPLYLNEIIASFEKMLRRTLRENIEMEIRLTPELNPIEADAGQLEQVILNLVLNAQDAMPGGGKILICTENRILDADYTSDHEGLVPGPYVMLGVSDTGGGMDAETQSKIFEPFFTTKAPGKGTGLGLATVYGIVKQHMGNIWLYSEPLKGTTFNIYFPQVKRDLAKVAEQRAARGAGGNETILVVEDQEQVRKVTSIMLKQRGYRVLEAENGRRALEIAARCEGRIDLLVSDIVMPGMNGRELYDELSKTRPRLEALFLSGYPREIISHHGILLEGYHFLSKPVLIDELHDKVRAILDTQRREGGQDRGD